MALDDDLVVNRSLVIPASELEWRFSASSGPGGQSVNTSNSRAEVRFDIATSPSLNDSQRTRLVAKLGDEVRVVSQTERSQLRNRTAARERLAQRLREALVVPRPRRPTRPTRGSVERRLDSKSRRAETKRDRQPPAAD